MRQTLEQAAKEYAEEVYCNSSEIEEWGLAAAFEDGAEWQNKQSPWISVKDRLPQTNTPVFVVDVKECYEAFLSKSGKWCACTCVDEDGDDCFLNQDTYWMPIPPLPKGGAE